jgi:hypothetical protein
MEIGKTHRVKYLGFVIEGDLVGDNGVQLRFENARMFDEDTLEPVETPTSTFEVVKNCCDPCEEPERSSTT